VESSVHGGAQPNAETLGGGGHLESEWLTTVAEVAAALASFAPLAGLLGKERFDRLAILGVVEASFVALIAALAPHLTSASACPPGRS